MENRKIIFLIIILLILFIGIFLGVIYYKQKEVSVEKPEQIASEFIQKAETYSYQDTDEGYIDKLRPFISKAYLDTLNYKEIGISTLSEEEKFQVTTEVKKTEIINQKDNECEIQIDIHKKIFYLPIGEKERDEQYIIDLAKEDNKWKVSDYKPKLK